MIHQESSAAPVLSKVDQGNSIKRFLNDLFDGADRCIPEIEKDICGKRWLLTVPVVLNSVFNVSVLSPFYQLIVEGQFTGFIEI